MDRSTLTLMVPSTVAQAKALGGKIPQGLLDAQEAYALIGDAFGRRDTEAERLLQTAPPEEVPGLIDQVAAEQYCLAAVGASHETVERALSSRLLREFGQAAPLWLAEIAPTWNAAAESFVAALESLPGDLSSGSLLSSGSAVVRKYEEAAEAAAVLDACRGLRNGLTTGIGHAVQGIGSPAVEVATRYVAVEHEGIARQVADIFQTAQGPLQPWAAIVRTEGVLGLVWHRSLQEHAEVLQGLPEAPSAQGRRRSVLAL